MRDRLGLGLRRRFDLWFSVIINRAFQLPKQNGTSTGQHVAIRIGYQKNGNAFSERQAQRGRLWNANAQLRISTQRHTSRCSLAARAQAPPGPLYFRATGAGGHVQQASRRTQACRSGLRRAGVTAHKPAHIRLLPLCRWGVAACAMVHSGFMSIFDQTTNRTVYTPSARRAHMG